MFNSVFDWKSPKPKSEDSMNIKYKIKKFGMFPWKTLQSPCTLAREKYCNRNSMEFDTLTSPICIHQEMLGL